MSAHPADAIYQKLPKFECKGLCHRSCGPIALTQGERDRIEEKIGPIGYIGEDLLCPLLDKSSGKCTVYEIRPLLCRLYGMVKKMKCPHGCRPKKWVSNKKVSKLMNRMKQSCGEEVLTISPEMMEEALRATASE